MAGTSRAALRRRQDEAQARRDRIILLGTGGVLAAVAAIVLVGLYFTVYRPPREQVAVVDGRMITASAAADRATFFMLSEGGAFSRAVDDLAELGVDRVVRDAILLKDGPALVGAVTDEDADAKAREVLGNLEGDAYAKALQDVLQRADIDRQQYREILKARLVAERLTETFKAELPEAMDQRHVQRARTPSIVNAERVIERARAGEDFEKLAQQYGADRRLDVDQNWIPDEILVPEAREALVGLGAGEVSAPVMSGLYFDVYRVAEAEVGRPLTDEQRGTVAERRVDTWVKEHEAQAAVSRTVSAGASRWITKRVGDRVRAAFEAQQAQQKAKGK